MKSFDNFFSGNHLVIAACLTLAISADCQAQANQEAPNVDPAIKQELLSLILENSYQCEGTDSRFWTVGNSDPFGPIVTLFEVKNLDIEIVETPKVSTADKLNGLELKLVVAVSPDIAWRSRRLGARRFGKLQMDPNSTWSKWFAEVSHFGTPYPHSFLKENGVWVYDGMVADFSKPNWGVFQSISKDYVFEQQLCPGGGVAIGSKLPPPAASSVVSNTTSTVENASAGLRAAYSDNLDDIELVAKHADHAILAWATYRDPEALSLAKDRGWNPMTYVVRNGEDISATARPSADQDVVAILFEKGDPNSFDADDEYVMAFRGTNFKQLEDLIANGQIVLPLLPEKRVDETANLASNIESLLTANHGGNLQHLTFVGHSLGGRLAMIARHATGRDAVVFNASPLSAREIGHIVNSKARNGALLVAFRSPFDPLAVIDPSFASDAIEIANIDPQTVLAGFREVYPNSPIPDETGAPDPSFATAGSTPSVVEGGFDEWVKYNHNIGILATAMQDIRIELE